MDKIIFVNATAATESGALTILKQFLKGISKYSNKGLCYYVLCSLEKLKVYESENVKIINNINGKKWLDRIKWELCGLKNWGDRKQYQVLNGSEGLNKKRVVNLISSRYILRR